MKNERIYLSGTIHCPIWQCGGLLYIQDRTGSDDAWQMPDIVCDNCGTVFVNSLRKQTEELNKPVSGRAVRKD